MLESSIKHYLLALLVCVWGIAGISYAVVGEFMSPGSLRGSKTISDPGRGSSLSGGGAGGIGNLYSTPQGSGVLSTSINRAPQHQVLRKNRSVHDSNVMRSNISRSSTATHRRTGGAANIPAARDISKIPRGVPGKGKATQKRTSSAGGTILGKGGVLKPGEARPVAKDELFGNLVGETYLAAIEHKSATRKDRQDESITTLVPVNPGVYRDKMQAAEAAFRNRQFREAISLYDMAGGLSSNSPESLLGRMHAYFAASTNAYALPALYLKNTLECFPELPLVNINLKAFYSDPIQYRRDLTALERYVKNNPKDADAQLVLGYFLWREGEIDNSKKALNMAVEYSKQPELNEAIDTLWSGMVASGKVSGKLEGIDKSKSESQEDKKATPSPETSKSE